MTELLDRRRVSDFRTETQKELFSGLEKYEEQLRRDQEISRKKALEELKTLNGDVLTNHYKEPGPKDQHEPEMDHLRKTLDLFRFDQDFDQIIQELGKKAIFETWVVNWCADGVSNPENNGILALSAFIFQTAEQKTILAPNRWDSLFYQSNGYYRDNYDPMWGNAPRITKPKPYEMSTLEGDSFYVILFENVPEEGRQPEIKVFIGENPYDNWMQSTLSSIFGIEDEKRKREYKKFRAVVEIHEENEPIRRRINRLEDRANEYESSVFFEEMSNFRAKENGYDIKTERLKALASKATVVRKEVEEEIKELEKKLHPLPQFEEEPKILEITGANNVVIGYEGGPITDGNTLFGQSSNEQKKKIYSYLQTKSVPFVHNADFYDYMDTAFWARVGEFLKKIPAINDYINSV